jgi:hypothetical protein
LHAQGEGFFGHNVKLEYHKKDPISETGEIKDAINTAIMIIDQSACEIPHLLLCKEFTKLRKFEVGTHLTA